MYWGLSTTYAINKDAKPNTWISVFTVKIIYKHAYTIEYRYIHSTYYILHTHADALCSFRRIKLKIQFTVFSLLNRNLMPTSSHHQSTFRDTFQKLYTVYRFFSSFLLISLEHLLSTLDTFIIRVQIACFIQQIPLSLILFYIFLIAFLTHFEVNEAVWLF